MFHRRNRTVLAAGITIAVIGAMASPASARASTGADPRSPTAAATAGPAHAADSPVAPFLWGAANSSYQVEGGTNSSNDGGTCLGLCRANGPPSQTRNLTWRCIRAGACAPVTSGAW